MHGRRRRRSPLKQIETFKQIASKDKKTTLSTIGTTGLKEEYGRKKLTGFGALVAERSVGKGKLGVNLSKVLEYNPNDKSNITSVGLSYKTNKGLSLGISGEKGSFKGPHHNIKTTLQPKLNIKKKSKRLNYSLKIGKNSGMFGITYNL
tara:strand:- start:79 stop:525 length:447 start_codon:yes stop_codon:yes gene_type:complete